jgi:hypothetical protein
MVELNYQVQQLPGRQGVQQNLPDALLRFGLPARHHELFIILPNRLIQSHKPGSGSTSTSVGLKQSYTYNAQWIFATEEVALLPGGSYAYGAQDWGASLGGMASFTINEQINIEGMLSVARYSDPRLNGGKTFYSVNPDVVLSYAPNAKVSLYAEIYGQSKLSADDTVGFNFDAGVLVLLNSHVVMNFSAGQQLYNYLNDVKHYANVGFSLLLEP